MSEIQKRLKKQRLKNNYTLAELAELLNVKEATVQRYESGEIKNIKHDTIVKLAEILQCTPSYLMGWQDDAEPQKSQINELTPEEIEIIRKYRDLSDDGKRKLRENIEDILLLEKYKKLPRQQGYKIAAWGADETEGDDQPPIEEITT